MSTSVIDKVKKYGLEKNMNPQKTEILRQLYLEKNVIGFFKPMYEGNAIHTEMPYHYAKLRDNYHIVYVFNDNIPAMAKVLKEGYSRDLIFIDIVDVSDENIRFDAESNDFKNSMIKPFYFPDKPTPGW
jgi:hypothetical protein